MTGERVILGNYFSLLSFETILKTEWADVYDGPRERFVASERLNWIHLDPR